MKLLIVHTSLRSGGAEKSLINLLNELSRYNIEIDLLLFSKEGLFLNQIPESINLIEIEGSASILMKSNHLAINEAIKYRYWKFLIQKIIIMLSEKIYQKLFKDYLPTLRSWLNITSSIPNLSNKYDIAVGYIQGSPSFYVLEKVIADKKISYIHNDPNNDPNLQNVGAFYNRFHHIFACSESVKSKFDKKYPYCSHKTSTLRNITSIDSIYSKVNEYSPPEFKCNNFNILSIGRCNHQKGFDMAIKASKILKSKNIDFCWYIIGRHKELIEHLVYENNVSDRFIFLGERDNPYPYIKNCDLYAQPSRYEGRSIAIDEAMICNKAVLVTNFETVNEQVNHLVNGFIVEMNPESIAFGIEYLISNRSVLNQLNNQNCLDFNTDQELKHFFDIINFHS